MATKKDNKRQLTILVDKDVVETENKIKEKLGFFNRSKFYDNQLKKYLEELNKG